MSIVASEAVGGGHVLFHPGNLEGHEVPLRRHDCHGTHGAKVSLNALRLGESFDTIKLDVGLLAWHIDHFPVENDTTGEKVSEDELHAILELSQNIGTNVDKIFSLRSQPAAAAKIETAASIESFHECPLSSPEHQHFPHHRGAPTRRRSYDLTHIQHGVITKRQRSLSCRTCLTHHTPKWRNGPAGPGTLCNVCGLIYAKRRGRTRAKAARQPSSC